MGQILHYEGVRKGPLHSKKVFIATPSYGDVCPAYTHSMVMAAMSLRDAGIDFDYELYTGNCHVDDSRNRLVRDFLETDCTDLVFIDADLRFEGEALVRLCGYDLDVVAGIYPYKDSDESYPVRHKPGVIEYELNGLIEVEGVPTGFLKIKRHVLEALASKAHRFPSKEDGKKSRTKIPIIFERTFNNHTRWGGDYTFCNKWREMGGKIYIDPFMLFEHYGPAKWSGLYSSYLKKTGPGGFNKEIEAIRNGTETPDDLINLVNGWGNPYYQTPVALLQAVIMLARESVGPILECGSGLSTIVMGAASKHPVWALEHDPTWAFVTENNAKKLGVGNIKVCYSPLKEYGDYDWYTYPSDMPQFDMLYCDGPPRVVKGYRRGVLEIKGYFNPGSLVAFDDYDPKRLNQDFAMEMGFETTVVDGERPFLVGRKP